MYDENQIVTIKWNNNNQEWFESRGYTGYKRYKEFEVKAKDLPDTSKIEIEAVCDYCGEAYRTSYSTIRNGEKIFSKHACPNCAGRKASDVSREKRAEKNWALLNAVCDRYGYILLTDITEFTNVKMNVQFLCPKHGVQTSMLDNLKRGHSCSCCSYEERANLLKLDLDYVEKTINSTNGNRWLNKDSYKSCTEHNLLIKCSCGNTYETSFVNFRDHGINRCHSCAQSESLGEMRIRDYLDANNISYIPQFRLDGCKDKKPLPFDFGLPELNKCIEFDGLHHYRDVRFEGQHQYVSKHDQIKTNYCIEHGIDLIRIPYWDYENIEKILDERLAI